MKKLLAIVLPVCALLAVMLCLMQFNPKLPVEPTTEIKPATIKTVTAPEGHMIATATPTPIMAAVQEPEPIQVLGAVLTGTIIEEEPDENTETGTEESYQEISENGQAYEEDDVEDRSDAAEVDSEQTSQEGVVQEGTVYLGAWTITAYCGCPQCCGDWSGSPTASGAWPSEGWTVACGSLPFGSIVYIEGLGTRCVEDRGVYGDWIDVYFDDHDAADSFGMQELEVWLVQ